MPMLPHNFPSLRQIGNGNYRPSVLLIGAGMSFGLVPMPGILLAEKRITAEAQLGFTSTLPVLPANPAPEPNYLYEWADEIITQLTASGNANPKLSLAKALDIPYETRWLGCISAQRSAPRHRVIARLAREGLWDQIWSLNWDCVQESALENVGIKRNADDALLQWPNTFSPFFTAAHCAQMGNPYCVKVVKPHGCVKALVDAENARVHGNENESVQLARRFLITKSELDAMKPKPGENGTQHFIFANLSTRLCTLPFVIAGWRAAEKYLLDHIDAHVKPALDNRKPLSADELSIIDIEFNNKGHTQLAAIYGKDRSGVHIPIDPTGFSTDRFFLWLQALYAVDCLSLRPQVLGPDKAALAEITDTLEQAPDGPSFAIEWVDNFLPVWVRLCWRCGLVQCQGRAFQAIDINDIDLESRDEHIPWGLPQLGIVRHELIAAARLLARLHRSGNGATWNYEKFPGGFYRDSHLTIPLPAWGNGASNDLQGLKALVDAIKLPGAGYIDAISVVFLVSDPATAISGELKQELKERVVSALAMLRFARPADIGEIELEDL